MQKWAQCADMGGMWAGWALGLTSSRCARKNFSGASRMSVNERRPVRTSERSTSALCAGSVAFGT